ANITDGQLLGAGNVFTIGSVSTDSRRMRAHALFVALPGEHHDGHEFVDQAFAGGAVAALVSKKWHATQPTGALNRTFVVVEDPLRALQDLGRWWRQRYPGLVVAVTGSNGKTIVKDALVELMSAVMPCAGSLGSYNSQMGVPLALLQMPQDAQIWVSEAGVSHTGEMGQLQRMLLPNFGILTNIGLAHIAGFGSREAIAREKMRLFSEIPEAGWVLVPRNEPLLTPFLGALRCRVIEFGGDSDQIPYFSEMHPSPGGLSVRACFPDGTTYPVLLPTPSRELAMDLEAAAAAAYLLGVPPAEIARRIGGIGLGQTRMEIWHSPFGTTLINDACSADPISVEAALRTLNGVSQALGKKVFVFGGMRELGERGPEEHAHIGELAAMHGVDLLVLPEDPLLDVTAASYLSHALNPEVVRYARSRELTARLQHRVESGDTILFKGPRGADIAGIAHMVFEAIAPNRLIVDLGAIAENIRIFRRLVGPTRQILAMIKALGYGSDMPRLSLELEKMGVDVLGVSTPDEGAALRRMGARLPILVMIGAPEEAGKLVRYRLTPVIASESLIEPLSVEAQTWGRTLDVHLKVDTGMGRMGIQPSRLPAVIARVLNTPGLRVTGLMTHFGCADDPAEDDFTRLQMGRFSEAMKTLAAFGVTDFTAHAAATSAAVRFPDAHHDMVRIGLGLYGLYPSEAVRQLELRMAVSLVSRIMEVREVEAGTRIGYGGTYVVPEGGARIGLVPMGYHDGVPWTLSNRGRLWVAGKPVPIVGRVSMDSLMLDITDLPEAERGSDVLVFGSHEGMNVRPEEVAEVTGTIVYELLTRIGPRVQRIFRGS
ncbi:alanine racemase, partial [Myxococcota bacterium]|nr:alanine racemase [Myxococcota bacterium]MBU1510791.1 alanine racemase [Myxococcota bacterium]